MINFKIKSKTFKEKIQTVILTIVNYTSKKANSFKKQIRIIKTKNLHFLITRKENLAHLKKTRLKANKITCNQTHLET